MLKGLLLFFLVAFWHNLMAQQPVVTPILVDSWHIYPIPTDSATIDSYGWDTTSWTLYQKDGRIYAINTFEPFAREQVPGDSIPSVVRNRLWKAEKLLLCKGKRILEVDNGYLIGINKGEWGGYILWYSKDGKKGYKVSDHQVVQFIIHDNKIYAVEGLAHLNLSVGNLIEVKKYKNKWRAEKILTLPYAPIGVAINSKSHLVVGTSNNIIEIMPDGHYVILYDTPFWCTYGYLYPESVFIQNDILYLGMRKGILRLDLRTNKKEWLMRN